MDGDQDGILGEPQDGFENSLALTLPDLELQSPSVPNETANGANLSISWTVSNVSSATARGPWTDRAVLSLDQYYGNNDDLLIGSFIRSADLLGTVSYTAAVTGKIPYGIQGNYRIFIQTDSAAALAGESTGAASASNPANFALVNLQTGAQIPVASVRHDALTRTSQLLFETLPPAQYELRIAPTIQSEQGVPLGGEGFRLPFLILAKILPSRCESHARGRRSASVRPAFRSSSCLRMDKSCQWARRPRGSR